MTDDTVDEIKQAAEDAYTTVIAENIMEWLSFDKGQTLTAWQFCYLLADKLVDDDDEWIRNFEPATTDYDDEEWRRDR